MAKLLGATAVAERLQVSRPTFYRWCDSGKIPHVRTPDGGYLVPEEALDAWLLGLNVNALAGTADHGRHDA